MVRLIERKASACSPLMKFKAEMDLLLAFADPNSGGACSPEITGVMSTEQLRALIGSLIEAIQRVGHSYANVIDIIERDTK